MPHLLGPSCVNHIQHVSNQPDISEFVRGEGPLLLHGVTLTKNAERATNPTKARIDQPSRPRKTPQAISLTLILRRGSEVGKTSGGSVNAGLLGPGVSTLSKGVDRGSPDPTHSQSGAEKHP